MGIWMTKHIMLVVRGILKIEYRPPKSKPGRGRRICDTSSWKHKKETFWMSAGFIWNWNHSSAVCSIAKRMKSFTTTAWFAVKSLVASPPQVASQWTLWSFMISVSWATNCFQVHFGLPRVWVVSPIWYSSFLCTFIFVCFSVPLNLLPAEILQKLQNWRVCNFLEVWVVGFFPGTTANYQGGEREDRKI